MRCLISMLKDLLQDKKLFIFDLDGTVTDTEPLHRISYDRALRELCPGQTMEKEDFLKNYVGSSETVIYERMKGLRGIDFDDGEFFSVRIDKLFEAVAEFGLDTAPFYKQLSEIFADREFIALTSQRTEVLDRFRKVVDYGKIEKFISVADKPYGKKEVLCDTENYLGYKACECVIFEDFNRTLRIAKENGILAIGVSHELNALTCDDCDLLIDIHEPVEV